MITHGETHRPTQYIISPLAKTSLDKLFDEPLPEAFKSRPMTIFAKFAGIVSAAAVLHSRDDLAPYIHHDIKPENILVFGDIVTCDMQLRLGDLEDIIRLQLKNAADSSRQECQNSGKRYAAPEGRNNGGGAYCRSDVFSLGALGLVLYVYLKYGAGSVKNFESCRLDELKRRDIKTEIARFYYQKDRTTALLDIVDQLLKEMEADTQWREAGMVLRSMMDVDREMRLRSEQANARLHDIAYSAQ